MYGVLIIFLLECACWLLIECDEMQKKTRHVNDKINATRWKHLKT